MKKVVSNNAEGRNWSIIGYPGDSLPDNYAELLDDLHLPWCESPVHSPVDSPDGLERKKHIHFLFAFAGNKSFSQMCEIANLICSPQPMRVGDLRSMVRYLVHADHPEREQFDGGFNRIKYHGGLYFDPEKLRSQGEYDNVLWDIVDFCIENDIDEFSDLVRHIRDNGIDDWKFVISRRNTLFLSSWLRSLHFKNMEASYAKCDRQAKDR